MKPHGYFLILMIAMFFTISGCATKAPLIKASANGDYMAVKKLIEEGANVNESDNEGYTPLMHAIWSGEYKTVKFLINEGADIHAKDSNAYTPLLWASYYGFLDIAKLIIDLGADINARSNDKYSPLLLASWSNDELSKLLIDKGADINAQDASGATALHNTDSFSLIRYLLDKSADTSLKNERGWTALRQAIYDKKIIKVALIRRKTNWQEGIYTLTSEEKIGRSVFTPPQDMFDVSSDKDSAYNLATYDCNAMIFKNVNTVGLLAELNFWGLPTVARMASNAYQKKGLFQECMAVMGFECKHDCVIDKNRLAAIPDTPSSKTIDVPPQNTINTSKIDYFQYSQSLVRGKTTKQDVENDLSQPTEQSFSGDYEYCAYYYRKPSLNTGALILYRLTLKYDEKGTLCDYVNVVVN